MPGIGLRLLTRAPGLKRIPLLKFLALAEIAALARNHANKLTGEERKRVLELVSKTRGRTTNLTDAERDELTMLVMKAEPRLFAGTAADKLSPIPLPKRIKFGPKSKRSA